MPLMHAAVNGMCEDSGIDLVESVPLVDNKLVMVIQIAPRVVFPLTVGEGCLLLALLGTNLESGEDSTLSIASGSCASPLVSGNPVQSGINDSSDTSAG